MKKFSFWSILKTNLKCVFCKYKNCRLRYYPSGKKYYLSGGTRYVDECKKDRDNKFNKVFK